MKYKTMLLWFGFCVCTSVTEFSHAGLWATKLNFDWDESAWGLFTTPTGGNSIWRWGAPLAREGSKSGNVWVTSGYSSIGRNVQILNFSGRDYNYCAATMYALGDPGYLEIIDTATWRYLAPLAHFSGGGSYQQLRSGQFYPSRKDVFVRYVVATSGGYKSGYIDDGAFGCQYY